MLKLNITDSAFNNITLKDKVNKEKLDLLLKQPDDFFKQYDWTDKKTGFELNTKTLLKKLKKSLGRKTAVNVIYKRKDYNNNIVGRTYQTTEFGYQRLNHNIRNFLCFEDYIDLDIVNAQPSILLNILKQSDIHFTKYNNLTMFNSNRDTYYQEVMETTGKSRKDVKMLFCTLLNGGSFSSWCFNQKLEGIKEPESIKALHKELDEIMDIVFENNTELHIKGKSKGSLMSKFLQEYENRCLEIMYNYLLKKKIIKKKVCSLIFDGLMIENNNVKDLNKTLMEMEYAIKTELGFDIKIISKPMEIDFELQDELEQVEDDEEPDVNEEHYFLTFTDGALAIYFSEIYNDYLFCDDILYHWDGCLWREQKTDGIISKKIIVDFFKHIKKIIRDNYFEDRGTFKKLIGMCNQLQNVGKVNNITTLLKREFLRKDIKFNTNPYLITFKNGVYDFKNDCFRDSIKEEYINDGLCCGYDYKAPDKKKLKFLETEFINKILPVEEEKDVMFLLLGTCLLGLYLKNFTILNGSGNNGKSVLICDFLRIMLGNYFYKGNNSFLFESRSSGGSPEIANFNMKRVIIFEEPSIERVINGSAIKDITGSSIINARMLYSNNTETYINGTFFVCCNDKPNIYPCDNAVRNRLIDFPFRSTFGKVDDAKKNKYLINKNFAEDDFFNEYKLELFHLIKEYTIKYLKNKDIELTPELNKRRDEYLVESDETINWINDHYQHTTEDSYVTLRDMWSYFKESELYRNLSSYKKRSFTMKKFFNKIKNHFDLSKFYKEEYLNGDRRKTAILFNYKYGRNEEEPECLIEDDEDDILTI